MHDRTVGWWIACAWVMWGAVAGTVRGDEPPERGDVRADMVRWVFEPGAIGDGFRAPDAHAATPRLRLRSSDLRGAVGAVEPVFAPASVGGGLCLDGRTMELAWGDAAASDADTARPWSDALRPDDAFTVGAWVSIDRPLRWGGIVGAVRDDGGIERGWVLGYDETSFTIGLATEGADDGDGAMTYVAASSRPYEIGRWHHVVATYDGQTTRLYVDGTLHAESAAQSGPLLTDPAARLAVGAYRDPNEHHRHDGRLREVAVAGHAIDAGAVAAWHASRPELVDAAPWSDTALDWLVHPFLTWPTTDAMSITWETTVPCTATLEVWHETGEPTRTIASAATTLHQIRVTGLRPHEKYFYRVTARPTVAGVRPARAAGASSAGRADAADAASAADGTNAAEDPVLVSDLGSFRTAPTEAGAFTFVAIGDTQQQAPVGGRVADRSAEHRPNLVVHAGDLVQTGSVKSDWTGHFFPVMRPLIARVPLMPVLGNHEQDAKHYYDYMDLPAPERWYAFTFGNAEFFMIDGNRDLSGGSAQLAWLESALSVSTATWKFAVLHQPPYTSDADDYGDTTRTTSTRGDPNARQIVGLLEQYGVDICFSGHVHDYERTFPIKDGVVTAYEDGGVIYVTTAGGGGSLEDFDPVNTRFGHKKARVHHLTYVAVHGGHLEFQAIDEYGRLFDVFTLRKDATGRRAGP